MDDFCGCALTAEPLTGKLLGRTIELNKILSNLTRSPKQSTAIIQTAAPSGSGKSSLLRELVRIFINGEAVSNFESLALTSTSGPDTDEVHPPQELSIKGHEDTLTTELKISVAAAGPASPRAATPTSAVPASDTTSVTPTTKTTSASSPKVQTTSKSQEV